MKNANIQTVKLNLSKAPTKRLKRTGKKKKNPVWEVAKKSRSLNGHFRQALRMSQSP